MARSNTRWIGVGALIALLLGGALVWVMTLTTSDASRSTEVAIPPCRIADTRPGDLNVGSRNTPIGAGETHTFVVRGVHLGCTIPDEATAVSMVFTVHRPTERSEMTVWPSDVGRPTRADLVYSAGRETVSTELTERLSSAGTIDVRQTAGSVDVSIDVTAYFVPGDVDRLGTPTNAPVDDELRIGDLTADAADPADRVGGDGSATDTPTGDGTNAPAGDETTTTTTPAGSAPTTVRPGSVPTTADPSTTVGPTATSTSSTTTSPAPPTTDRPREDRVVLVALTGGDFTQVQPALDSITTATADARWLVRIAPGVYDGAFTLKSHVDVEGAGQSSTTVVARGGNTDPISGGASATVRADGTVDAELRNLTVASDGGTYAVGIRTQGAGGSVKLTQVTVRASGGTRSDGVVNVSSSPRMSGMSVTASGAGTANHGVLNTAGSFPSMSNLTANGIGAGGSSNVGVFNQGGSSPSMSGVTATASGGQTSAGVRAHGGSSPALSSVTATASGAVVNLGLAIESSTPSVAASRLSGSTASIANAAAGGFSAVDVASTVLSGPVTGDGYFSCTGVTDGAGVPLGDECG